MGYFEKLNKAWQEGINAEINDSDGGQRPEIATAFREHYAKYLHEIKTARKPSKKDRDEIGEFYAEFSTGWEAARGYHREELLLSIREVQEGGKRLANHYLSHGYILLDIQSAGRARRFPEDNRSGQQYYVHRNPVYVLGRPFGVAPAPSPPTRKTAEGNG